MRLGLIAWALTLLLGCGGLPSVASSTFEADAEGWQVAGDASDTPELRANGGNPGGTICSTDAAEGDIWYFVAPQRYLGDVSRAYGKRLIWDLKQFQSYYQLKGRDVVLNGGGLAVVFNIRQTPGRDWTPYSATLDAASGWLRDDTDQPATEAEMLTVLKNLTALRLRGEFADGPDVACLDNVYFGTP